MAAANQPSPTPGTRARGKRYTHILRALGRILDEAGARDAEITEQQEFMAVSWRAPGADPDKRTYNELGLLQLAEKSRELRGGLDWTKGELAELLRTIGQELDDMRFDLSRIQEDEEGFTVSGVIERHYQSLYFRKTQVRELSRERRAGRAPERKIPAWRFWQR